MNLKLSVVLTVAAFAVFALIRPTSAEAIGDRGMKGKPGQAGIGGGMSGAQDADASPGEGEDSEEMRAFIAQRADWGVMKKRGFFSTGLKPVYPDNFDCPKATSLFASLTRSDGSKRASQFFHGLHGGMDIPMPAGTPLLALADGELIVKQEANLGGIGGMGIWVRHAPEDTGTGKFVFVEYKHIPRFPDLAIGARVKMGQVIAETGNTGTTGGYYGANGFYHLHMTAYWSDSPDFDFKRHLIPVGGQWLDPLALLRGGPLDSHSARELSDDQKKVPIPFKTTDGRVFPERTKMVWPYVCAPK